MSTIKILPKALANQIAAGEVIERPASVVKELLENSLDAGATKISLEIIGSGVELIKVTDNGKGIAKEELELAICPHATSKISTLEDLFSVKTLGFRGEALASIASVAKLKLCSLSQQAEKAYCLEAEGGEKLEIKKSAHPQGTSIWVEDLFFNALSRRRFLRSSKTERLHIEAMVKRLAMCQPNLELALTIDGRNALTLMPATTEVQMKKRVERLFGQPFMKEAKWVSAKAGDLSLSGFLGSPNYLRSQNDLQFCFVNNRVVRDKLLMHAIQEAYEPLLYPGRQATFLLYLRLPESKVDVNVHPTKHEVRFYEPRNVHDFVGSVIKRNLQKADSLVACHASTSDSNTKKISWGGSPEPRVSPHQVKQGLSFLSAINETKAPILLPRPYVLIEQEGEKVILNVEKCYQRLLSDRLKQAASKGELTCRPLLVPLVISCEREHFKLPFNILKQYGLTLEPLSDREQAIRSFPVLTPYLNLQALMQELASLEDEQDLLKALVFHSNVSWELLSNEDQELLKEELLSLKDDSAFAKVLNQHNLEKMFNE